MSKKIRGGWANLPMHLLKDKRLRLGDFKVLAVLAYHSNAKEGYKAWPNAKTIADESGVHISSISKTTSRLAKLGYIKKSKGWQGKSCDYWLTDQYFSGVYEGVSAFSIEASGPAFEGVSAFNIKAHTPCSSTYELLNNYLSTNESETIEGLSGANGVDLVIGKQQEGSMNNDVDVIAALLDKHSDDQPANWNEPPLDLPEPEGSVSYDEAKSAFVANSNPNQRKRKSATTVIVENDLRGGTHENVRHKSIFIDLIDKCGRTHINAAASIWASLDLSAEEYEKVVDAANPENDAFTNLKKVSLAKVA